MTGGEDRWRIVPCDTFEYPEIVIDRLKRRRCFGNREVYCQPGRVSVSIPIHTVRAIPKGDDEGISRILSAVVCVGDPALLDIDERKGSLLTERDTVEEQVTTGRTGLEGEGQFRVGRVDVGGVQQVGGDGQGLAFLNGLAAGRADRIVIDRLQFDKHRGFNGQRRRVIVRHANGEAQVDGIDLIRGEVVDSEQVLVVGEEGEACINFGLSDFITVVFEHGLGCSRQAQYSNFQVIG